jgi:uncharacterized membrane protein
MLGRLARHLAADLGVRRRFLAPVLRAIEGAVAEQEKRHVGELRFAIEGGLPALELLRGRHSRSRAIELFGQLGVWDTEHNSGVLIYVLLGDRAVEIVADRGIGARVPQPEWDAICRAMEKAFRADEFERGALEGIARIGELLARHFPAAGGDNNTNELPDRPVVL